MAAIIRMRAEDWLKQPEYEGVEVFDDDGWRGDNRSWYDSIDEQEFARRLMHSTVSLPSRLQLAKT